MLSSNYLSIVALSCRLVQFFFMQIDVKSTLMGSVSTTAFLTLTLLRKPTYII